MEETKKQGVFGTLCKIAFWIAAVYAALTAIGKLVAKKARELEEKNAGQKKKSYLTVMNGQLIKIGNEEIEEITLRAYLGGVTVDLTEAEFAKETQINITGVISGVAIKVPPMVRVQLTGTNVLSGFANMVPNYEAEDLPVVTVYAQSMMSGIAVQMVPEAKKA